MGDEVAVTLPRWQWVYFLGWLEAKRSADETIQITDTCAAVARAVRADPERGASGDTAGNHQDSDHE